MTNPTSNFGWQMPTATDLVTDLPADFEVFGQAVDSDFVDLLGGANGYILSKASATDLDFAWIPNDQGDITAVNVTSPITGGGSAGAVTIGINAATTSVVGAVQLSDSTSTTSSVLASTPTATKAAYDLADGAIAKSTVTTAGDIIYRNATVPARLGIGTAGQILAVNSGATAPEWIAAPTSGGMTLLSTTSLSGSSVSITGISGSYQNLFVEFIDYYSSSSASLQARFNSDSTAQAYQMISNYYAADNGNAQFAPYIDKFNIIYVTYGSVSAADNNNYANLTIPNYASSTVKKVYEGQSQFINAGGYNSLSMYQGGWFNSSAITSVQVISSAGTFSGGSVKIWGVK